MTADGQEELICHENIKPITNVDMKINAIVFYKQTQGSKTSVLEIFTDNKPHSSAYIYPDSEDKWTADTQVSEDNNTIMSQVPSDPWLEASKIKYYLPSSSLPA